MPPPVPAGLRPRAGRSQARRACRAARRTVLVYQRITDKSPVEASFPCTGALGDARQAVCRSQILAGLDRSVALTCERARKRSDGGETTVQSLEHDQAAWAAERDRSKADESCLIERMNDRIQDLMQR